MNTFAIISGILSGVENTVALIQKWRAAARQSGELTPEQDAQLDGRIGRLQKAETKPDHWKTDAELEAMAPTPTPPGP